MPLLPLDAARLPETHGARLARGGALGAHRLPELLEHAEAHRAGPLAGRDALGAAPLLRVAQNAYPYKDPNKPPTYKSGQAGFDSDPKQCCPPELQSNQGCHCEQKWAYDHIAQYGPGGPQAGQAPKQIGLTGDLPPCPNCHTAMMRAAQQTGSTVEYKWPKNPPQNSITYQGGPSGTGTGNVSGYSGGQANALFKPPDPNNPAYPTTAPTTAFARPPGMASGGQGSPTSPAGTPGGFWGSTPAPGQWNTYDAAQQQKT